MRIGIDARALTGRFTGDRTYWLCLLREYLSGPGEFEEHEYVLFTRLPIPRGDLPVSDRVTLRAVPAANDRVWTMVSFPRALKQEGVDVAHTQYTTPLRSPCPLVTTVHDISFRIYPEWFPRKDRVLLNLTVPASMRRARRVITDAESSRRDILRIYRLPPEKIATIHLAAGSEYHPMPQRTARAAVNARFGIDRPYVISVGVLQPRKNFALLLEAFARVRRAVPVPHRLVLTGKRGWAYGELARLATRLGISDALIYTDYVADADLPMLYSAADAMAFPSLYEGFGLPPLEAMACGTATLVSDAPAMPEVADAGAWVLPVMDATAWAEALGVAMTNEKARITWGERGRQRAAQFSWRRTAAQTLAVYHEALGS